MLACGRNSSAVLSPDGSLYTTGGNRWGQIAHGLASTKWFFESPSVDEHLRFVFVDTFDSHLAAVDKDGWGVRERQRLSRTAGTGQA